jgi:hypothetical protein
VRIHGETQQRPVDLLAQEHPRPKSETQRPSRKPGIGPPRGDLQPSLEKSYRTRTDWLAGAPGFEPRSTSPSKAPATTNRIICRR